jgi:hypothetical protein
MAGETIAQVHASSTLWEFLLRLPTTMEAQIWYALVLGGVLGMIGHYVRQRSASQIEGNPIDYFFRENAWRSIGAAVAMAIELFGEVGTGLFTTEAGQFVGWGIVILSGLKTGYLGDSVINKGKRPEWTERKREAMAVVEKT